MAITIHVLYHGKNGNAVQFAKEMLSSGLVNQIRKESGNISYDYFLPFDDSETVLLIDCWASQIDLDKHHKSLVMKQIASLREKYNLHMEVKRYISDNQEIPNADQSYIRK